jgi:hypothetical protein
MIASGGEAMKITVWLAARDRWTWIAAAEMLGLAVLLTMAVESSIARLLGFALLGHLGYSALTGLPMGEIPGRPRGGQQRRNLDLRAKVVVFLREIRRLEEYVQRARLSGWSHTEIQTNLQASEQRMIAAAADVAKVARRTALEPPDTGALPDQGASGRRVTVHAPPRAASPG